MTIEDLGVQFDALDCKLTDKIDTLQAVMNERFDQIGDQLIQLER